MMYYNTILYYGVDAFARKCAEVGVDGLIIPDLPKEEQFELVEALDNTEKRQSSFSLSHQYPQTESQ